MCCPDAYDVAKAAGLRPANVLPARSDIEPELAYPTSLGGIGVSTTPGNIWSYPGSLFSEFKGLASNQVQEFSSRPTAEDFSKTSTKLYAGIASYDPSDRAGIEARIAPVGTVSFVDSSTASGASETGANQSGNYNFPDTAGGGRGHINPELVTSPATVFNPATALANYQGDNAYIVKPGETVGSIAAKLDISEQALKNYLKEQYGDAADLNSIVAGRGLPVPADKLAAYKEATINGNDLPYVSPATPDHVNGSDLQSDQYVAPVSPPADPFHNALLNAFQNQQTSSGQGIQYAQAGNGTVSDAGGGGGGFSNLTPAQLAQALQSSSTGGLYGAGQMHGNSFVPLSATSKVLLTPDGQVIGEANTLPNGYTRFTDASGAVAYTTPNGQAVSEHVYQVGLATAGAGLAQSIIGLQNWDKQTTLGQVGTVVGMYNHINTLSEGALGAGSGLGSLGSLGAGLGFLSALESGDVGRSIYSGLSLVENLTSVSGVANSGWVSMNLPGGGNFLPVVGMVLAVMSGDPVQMLAAAVAFIPVYGPFLSIAVTILGSLFGGGEPERPAIPDTPMSEGEAHAQWDGSGNTTVVTAQDSFGGGATAAAWMNHLTGALQTRVAGHTDSQGNGYGLIANLLPSIGFQYDPDNKGGIGTAQLILRWTDEDGNPQHRNYDRNGNRGDGSTIAGDFMTHAQGAIAPNWQVQFDPLNKAQAQQLRAQAAPDFIVAANDERYITSCPTVKNTLKISYKSTFTLSNQPPAQWMRAQAAPEFIVIENCSVNNFAAVEPSDRHLWMQAA